MRKNLYEKCYVGTVIYSNKCVKTAVRETVDAEINNIYMELYSGAKMADGKYRKTYVAGSVHLENTVLARKNFCVYVASIWTILFWYIILTYIKDPLYGDRNLFFKVKHAADITVHNVRYFFPSYSIIKVIIQKNHFNETWSILWLHATCCNICITLAKPTRI
jgi:hypothetical protein